MSLPKKTPKRAPGDKTRAICSYSYFSVTNVSFGKIGLPKPKKPTLVQFRPSVRAGEHHLRPGHKNCQKFPKRGEPLILLHFGFQRFISVEWAPKDKETNFGAIRSIGKGKRASSLSLPKKRQNLLQGTKLGQFAHTSILVFPTFYLVRLACQSPRNQLWCDSVGR